ncbi:beta-galactosidase [Novosphingobium olei]|uniref:Beta-galactosidase n=1 Tax=Novosphingobium olei TaxID=2728851 RepID=A0A7Y0G9K8_9SPHN|nr:beta-galactosidase [Novosphingobium olei]
MKFVCSVATIAASIAAVPAQAAPSLPDTVLFGAAYYDEYTPSPRAEQDAAMMKAAGISVVRIAESTWSTLEPQPGQFDFTSIDRTLVAMHRNGIKVIVGTPTYAIPTWLAKAHPNVLVVRKDGPARYGPRQNMDITDPDFRAAAERVIVALIDHVRDHPAVIGYQLDNETKAYGVASARVQAAFQASLRERFGSTDALNKTFGLDYWSNRINSWEDFPDVTGTINASLGNAFAEYQRGLVNEYLAWQAGLVRAHARPKQFLTQNFDLEWRGYSYGVQPEVNHWQAARPLDVAGVDIYHPSQGALTGAEIAFGGDLARSIKGGQNYIVVETQAQGFPQWTPYPGQLRLQAYSHLASGANMIAYWHWASTGAGLETYWKGLLSQDYAPNPVLAEASTIGADLKRLGKRLVNLKKDNKVALYVSNAALTGMDSFAFVTGDKLKYNDVVRRMYDALYRQNIEADIVSPDGAADLSRYKLVIVPALYAASDAEISKLNAYAKAGGHVLYTFKSGFSDENTRVRASVQPGGLAEAAGVTFSQFAVPQGVTLAGDPYKAGPANTASDWQEMLQPTTASVLARYDGGGWPGTAALTRNAFGKGEVEYLGFMPSPELAEKILAEASDRAGVQRPALHWPLIQRSGILTDGKRVHYVLNYAATPASVPIALPAAHDLLSGKAVGARQPIDLPAWGVAVLAED